MPSQLIRQDLVPIVIGYLLVMGTLAVGLRMLRRPAPGSRRLASGSGRPVLGSLRRPAPGWPRLIVHLLATAAGGYLTLMAVVILYYYGVVRVGSQFVPSAVTGCALLLGLSVPVFIAASWLAERRGGRAGAGPRRRSRRDSSGTAKR
jgi:hypothetical protein